MKYELFTELVRHSKNTVFFGGAGVSTESGIPDFRSADGIYMQNYGSVRAETIISRSFFLSNPEKFYNFYRAHLLFPDAKPNRAHIALAELEYRGLLSCVITQNIDGLHQAAGSRRVVELHGTVHRNYCLRCGRIYNIDYILSNPGIPVCSVCGGMVRPYVTLFDEALPAGAFEDAVREISAADLLIVAGSSLSVQPAASLVNYFQGDNLVIINYDATAADCFARCAISESVGEVMGTIVSNLDETATE